MKKKMFVKKKMFKTIMLVLIVFSCLILPMSLNKVKAIEKEKTKNVHCILCQYSSKEDPMYKKEKQFYDKVKAIKAQYGDSIDEVALTAAVLHRYSSNSVAYNATYDKDYNKDEYTSIVGKLSNLFSLANQGLTESEEELVIANEKIDLIQLAAMVMVDSNHKGKYSDVCFKEGLAGDHLVGNTDDEDSTAFDRMFNSILNKVVCVKAKQQVGEYEGDSKIVARESEKRRVKNIDLVCENGYVGGLYSGVKKINDQVLKQNVKNRYAKEIIDLANYYKRLYGNLEGEGGLCPVGGISGNTQASILIGKTDEERIAIIGPIAQAAYSRTGVFASMTIAQALVESGIMRAYEPGRSSASSTMFESNNMFGIRCGGWEPSKCTPTYRKYSSLEEAIQAHADLFNNGYYTGWDTKTTPEAMLAHIIPTYAPSSDGNDESGYLRSAISYINQYDLKRFDVKGNVSSNYSCSNAGSSSLSSWSIRTIKPSASDKAFQEYESINGSTYRGQCVWYAKGRAFEIIDAVRDKGSLTSSQATHIQKMIADIIGNGGDIYDAAKSIFNSSNNLKEPKAGSFIVWKKPGSYGHVAIVEEVNKSANTITITSGYADGDSCPNNWDCVRFDTFTYSLDKFYSSFGQNYVGGYVFSGYIYFLEPLDMRDAWVSNDSDDSTSNCETKLDGDLIAKLAVAVAPTAAPDSRISVDHYKTKSDDSRAKAYNDIFYQTIAKYPSDGGGNPNARGDGYNNPAYASCAQAAAAIIRATVDPDISSGNPTSMEQYLKNNPEKWIKAGELKAGEKFTDKCKPGDLLLTVGNSGDSGHAMIYVGKYAKNNFPNTNGVVWEAANDMSSRYLYPGITDKKSWSSTMAIWRPTGKGSFYYPFIDISKYVDIDVSCKKNNSSGQVCINGQAVDGNNGVGSTNMNYSNAVEIPDYLWKNHVRWDTDPSIVVVDDSGNVLAQRKPNVRREGASTTKVFSGYAALKLLDVNTDVVTTTQFICSNTDNNKGVAVGTKTSVVDVATRDFPGSDNARADSIPLAIGYKYYSGSSDKDAYTVGLEKMNNLYRQIGCTNTNIGSGSGVISFNDSGWRSQDTYGIQTYSDGTGHTANDLALVTIEAMKDENFAGHFSNRDNEGLFYIKSGTGHCGHGIWGFNHNGKRYYISILGMNCNWSRGSHDVKHISKERTVKDIYNWVITDLIK